ncbi:cobalt-precorrin-6A reductase [Rhodoplanes sp. Z2-YC6860]|uniref:cobalt-precorrin-6A reductase n=1 Tax=Rhodoplanes sp. Z2-YC6860 TaxID=674703 RepID=UPI00078BFD59|nr:cobalt-precorrin-6A reductase [Rhodoplanes sp. Z2-YC6860]AMN43906.1 cobalt-precorrin-6x reductase [Rhodoplanes sp. Z2-YC6860]
MRNVLILGGTTEARQLAGLLAGRADIKAVLSLAGRTATPAAQPVPVRIGGFGGVEGLADYLWAEHVDALIDATHPYAAIISQHAAEATASVGVPIVALRRPAWSAVAGDRWSEVDDMSGAVAALGKEPKRVFLAIGRKEVVAFTEAPQHHYLIRSVDPIDPPLNVPNAAYILSRGPFPESDEKALLSEHRIDTIVAKNSGGSATYGKIAAARTLGLNVIMLRRPHLPDIPAVNDAHGVVAWLDHQWPPSTKRGV